MVNIAICNPDMVLGCFYWRLIDVRNYFDDQLYMKRQVYYLLLSVMSEELTPQIIYKCLVLKNSDYKHFLILSIEFSLVYGANIDILRDRRNTSMLGRRDTLRPYVTSFVRILPNDAPYRYPRQ